MVAHMYGLSIVSWSWVQVGWREVTVWIAVDDTVCVCVYAGRTSMHCTVIGVVKAEGFECALAT